jgi:MoaA/NifB/PqqE/SkfB family radical SAM enzyme
MQYDIEGAWALLRTCNYRCDYCFLSDRALGGKIRVHATPEQWRAAFDDTGKTWMIHLTGGEPSLYPDFAAVSELLAERHYLSLNSNLTGSSLVDFARRVPPGRVHYINAGLHPEERARKQGYEPFLRHATLLAERGFRLMVTVVATPEVLWTYDAIVASLRPLGLMPMPKLMQGKSLGRRYPESYTLEERRLFRDYSRLAEAAYPQLFADAQLRPTIDPPLGRAHLRGLPDHRGRLCAAGMEYVRIEADGRVERCGSGPSLGNLLARNVQFASAPAPCDRRHCFYVCDRYTQRAGVRQPASAGVFARMRRMVERLGVGA